MEVILVYMSLIILLFLIIFIAVRLAIRPLICKQEIVIEESNLGLLKLRDIGILTNIELKEVIQYYNKKNVKNREMKELESYSKVLAELVNQGFFTQEEYLERIEKLRDYYFNGNTKV